MYIYFIYIRRHLALIVCLEDEPQITSNPSSCCYFLQEFFLNLQTFCRVVLKCNLKREVEFIIQEKHSADNQMVHMLNVFVAFKALSKPDKYSKEWVLNLAPDYVNQSSNHVNPCLA